MIRALLLAVVRGLSRRARGASRLHVVAVVAALVFGLLLPFVAAGYLSTGTTGDRVWFWQSPLPQGNDLAATSWVSSSVGWACGANGTLLKSTDGGASWIAQDAATVTNLTGVSFVDANTGWVVGLSGLVKRTTDGGATWTSQTALTTPAARNFRSVSFIDSSHGIAVGDQGTTTATIVYTGDGGATWRQASLSSSVAVGLTSVWMTSTTRGWAVGGNGTLLRTSDGGATWSVRTSGTTVGLQAVSFSADGQTGYFVGNASAPNFTIYKTADGGSNWSAITTLGTSGAVNLFGVSAYGANEAAVIGANGQIRHTRDGGLTWLNQSQNSVGSNGLRGIELIDASNAKTVGDSGLIFYSTSGGNLWFSTEPWTPAVLYATSFFDSDYGCAVGANGTILRTEDAGRTWLLQAAGIVNWRAVQFADRTHGWIVGDNGQIARTTDGRNWQFATTPTTQQLNGVWFTSLTTGIAVGNNGAILKTTDGGTTWAVKPYGAGTVRNLNAVWFADANTGYAVGANGAVRKTTNGGETWAATAGSAGSVALLTVAGSDATHVWVAGSTGALRRTADGGATTWDNLTTNGGFGTQPIRAMSFTSATTGWIAGTYGIVKRTSDAGTTWTLHEAGLPRLTTDPAVGLWGMSFPDATTGFIVGDGGVIHRTLDGSASPSHWQSLQYGTRATLNAISTADNLDGWAVGTGGAVMHTSDGGQSWSQQRTGSTAGLNGVVMVDALRGWVVGDTGAIRRTDDGGYTWTAQTSGTTATLNDVASKDGVVAVAAGGTNVIKRTADSGTTWANPTVSSPTQPVQGLAMTDAYAYAVATRVSGNNVVWRSPDRGNTWEAVATAANANLWAVTFIDNTTGFVSGDSGVILKTIDAGLTWTRKPTPTTLPYYAIGFSDANNGVAVGGGGAVLRTSDGGETWAVSSSGSSRSLTGVDFFGTGRGWITGGNASLMRMSDLVPPITTLTKSPASFNGANGWYSSTPTLSLASTTTPVTSYYSWASAAGPFIRIDAASFTAPEGVQTLYYYSVDELGNTETPKSASINVDATLPTVSSSPVASLITTSTAQISWTAGTDTPSGVAYYNVYVNGSISTTASAVTTQVTGLTPGTENVIAIETVDAAGNVSATRSSVTFPTNGLVTVPLATDVTMTGTMGANGWYVTEPSVVMTAYPLPSETPVTYFSWTSNPPTGVYSYGTTLTPAAGLSTLFFYTSCSGRLDEPVRSLSFKVDTAVPGTPSVTATTTGYASIVATWPAVADPVSLIASYDVYLDDVLYSSVTSTGIDIVGLHSATPYKVNVRAVSFAGTLSLLSASAVATTNLPPLPDAPSVVFAKAPAGRTAFVNWSPVTQWDGAVTYRVWRSVDAGVTYQPLGTTSGGVYNTTYVDDGLTSTTRYWYAVSTIDARGEGPLSNVANTVWASTAPTTGPPARPTGFTASKTGGTVLLQWIPLSDPAVRYYVLRGPSSLSSSTTTLTLLPLASVTPTSTFYIDVNTKAGEPYYYSVVAVDAAGIVGPPSLEAEGRAVDPPVGGQTMPHQVGTSESGCLCHSGHSAAGDAKQLRVPGEAAVICEKCHAPATSLGEFLDPLAKSRHSLSTTSSVDNPFTCLTCHVPVYNAGEAPANLLRVNGSWVCTSVTGVPAGNGFCYQCHGVGSTLPQGDLTGFEQAGHNNIPAPPTGAGLVCDACHESHSSRNEHLNRYSGYMMCVQCHTSSASNPNEPDIWSKLQLNEDANAKHPLLPADQVNGARMMCQNCHNTHMTTATYPLVDPHDPSPLGVWKTPRSDEKAFCFRCHDGQALPTAVETTSWAAPVLASGGTTLVADIQTAYANNYHGYGVAATEAKVATITAFLRPDMGYTANTTLECRSCHDPHGTMNNYALQQNVVSASGDKTVSGLTVAKVPGGGYDLRFFCASCHVWDAASHTQLALADTSTIDFTQFPIDCTQCHRHLKADGTPSRDL